MACEEGDLEEIGGSLWRVYKAAIFVYSCAHNSPPSLGVAFATNFPLSDLFTPPLEETIVFAYSTRSSHPFPIHYQFGSPIAITNFGPSTFSTATPTYDVYISFTTTIENNSSLHIQSDP
jgi:hypothetical protein